jgi:hypothetical protein
VLHQRVLLVTVVIEEAPRIADEDRVEVIEIIETLPWQHRGGVFRLPESQAIRTEDAMAYPDDFLEALGAWQNGWREAADRRLQITKALEDVLSDLNLRPEALSTHEICYRKRFLVANNPQNGGDLVPLIRDGTLDEGVASWTTNRNFAQEFKDPLRTGTVSAIFGHKPQKEEVVLNIKALWTLGDFSAAVSDYKTRGGRHADALLNVRSRQSEVILRVPLLSDEIVGFCGRSSPFETLCELAGLTRDEDIEAFWKQLVDTNTFPEEPRWVSPEGVKNVLQRVRKRFNIG